MPEFITPEQLHDYSLYAIGSVLADGNTDMDYAEIYTYVRNHDTQFMNLFQRDDYEAIAINPTNIKNVMNQFKQRYSR